MSLPIGGGEREASVLGLALQSPWAFLSALLESVL